MARSFLFLAIFLAYFLEAFGKSPLAERDYAAVTWRVLVVLLLIWNYQAVFGGVIGVLDGLERQVAPASTWKAFVKQSYDMRKALEEVASRGERPSGVDGSPGSVASEPSGIVAWAYDALIACIQLVAEAAVFLVNWLSRILTATLFVLGPLALVAGIPRVSSTGSRWFLRFVTIASWPVFAGVLLSVLVTLGAQGAMRQTYLECLVGALVMLLTALATPIIAALSRQIVADAWRDYEEQLRSLGAHGVLVAVVGGKKQLLDRELLRMVGIEPERMRIVVVKSSNHFRADFQPIAREAVRKLSAGKVKGKTVKVRVLED